MLSFNEVGLRGQQANVYFQREDTEDEKSPVYEIEISKNKFGSFKGRIFFQFFPEMSHFREVPKSLGAQYAQMIKS